MREVQGIFSEDSYACQLLPEAVSTVTATLLLHVQTYGYADSGCSGPHGDRWQSLPSVTFIEG